MIPLSREILVQRGYCCHLGCQNCPYTPMIDTYLKELHDSWGYTIEELNDIKSQMAAYAMDAVMDSAVRKEAERICQIDNAFGEGMNKLADMIEEDLEQENE